MVTPFLADEFGVPQGAIPGSGYGWLGSKERETQLSSGVITMGARVYLPQLGRFLQVDPVTGGSATAYDYANQDPLNALDLDGMRPKRRATMTQMYQRFGIPDFDPTAPVRDGFRAFKQWAIGVGGKIARTARDLASGIANQVSSLLGRVRDPLKCAYGGALATLGGLAAIGGAAHANPALVVAGGEAVIFGTSTAVRNCQPR